jgi:hypothetical protein
MTIRPRTRPVHKPLKISCDQANCEQGQHCFRESKKLAKAYGKHETGSCQHCGEKFDHWERVQQRDGADATHTFEVLKKEFIRHHYWHKEIDQHAKNHAVRKGRAGLRDAVETRLRSSVGTKHSRDGRQTPWEGNVIYYAQHATACCCRHCIQYWHGIPESEVLSDEQVEYFKDLCLRFIFERMPGLEEQGRHVPPIRDGGREK